MQILLNKKLITIVNKSLKKIVVRCTKILRPHIARYLIETVYGGT